MVFMTTDACMWDLKRASNLYAKACAHPYASAWHTAMDREINSLWDMGAFLECDLLSGKKPLTLKWVYAQKMDSNGQVLIRKEKAQVVVQDFQQWPEDFGKTAALVAKLASVHLILSWAALKDLKIFQFNCKTAFLHTKLCYDIYSHSFPGWPVSKPGCVLKIIATLYRLWQSAYEFYMLFFSLLSDLGITHCDADHGVFYSKWKQSLDPSVPMPGDESSLVLIVPIHIDNSLGITNSIQLYQWFICSLSKKLHVVDLGKCSAYSLSVTEPTIIYGFPHTSILQNYLWSGIWDNAKQLQYHYRFPLWRIFQPTTSLTKKSNPNINI